MPGYVIHLASINNNNRNKRDFVLGVEAPDILKKHLKIYTTLEAARDKYNSLKVGDMPEYSTLVARIQQKEDIGSDTGLHYGVSSNPNIELYWNSLIEREKNSNFYRGYLLHLLTDKIVYKALDLDNKFKKMIESYSGDDLENYKKTLVKSLHTDWDKTNTILKNKYNTELTPEVEELGVVGFNSSTDLVFIDINTLINCIDKLRNIDILSCSIKELDKLCNTSYNSIETSIDYNKNYKFIRSIYKKRGINI